MEQLVGNAARRETRQIAKIQNGESVLIPLARNAGAGLIVAAARGEEKLKLARKLGAGHRPFAEVILPDIADALSELAAGRLKPTIGQIFPLADASSAHRAIEDRNTIGKTLLRVE